MSLEQKIKAMLDGKQPVVEQATLPISNMDNGDKKPIPAGSSQAAPSTELPNEEEGKAAAAPIAPAGAQATIGMKGDPTSVKVQSMEGVEVADLKADIAGLFEGQDETFVTKAAGLFEAAVVARVNAEVVKAVATLEESHAAALAAEKAKLSEEIDQYLSYVVESWMKENKVAVDAGLRTEVAEGFIAGLKNLFVENYIEVPEEKVDVLESLTTELDTTKSRLNEEIEKSVALSGKIVELEKSEVLAEAAKGLVATDAERLTKLVEGVEFDSKEGFAEKVAVIKEAHFKAPAKKSAEQHLAEQTGEGNTAKVVTESVQRYVDALSRSTRF